MSVELLLYEHITFFQKHIKMEVENDWTLIHLTYKGSVIKKQCSICWEHRYEEY